MPADPNPSPGPEQPRRLSRDDLFGPRGPLTGREDEPAPAADPAPWALNAPPRGHGLHEDLLDVVEAEGPATPADAGAPAAAPAPEWPSGPADAGAPTAPGSAVSGPAVPAEPGPAPGAGEPFWLSAETAAPAPIDLTQPVRAGTRVVPAVNPAQGYPPDYAPEHAPAPGGYDTAAYPNSRYDTTAQPPGGYGTAAYAPPAAAGHRTATTGGYDTTAYPNSRYDRPAAPAAPDHGYAPQVPAPAREAAPGRNRGPVVAGVAVGLGVALLLALVAMLLLPGDDGPTPSGPADAPATNPATAQPDPVDTPADEGDEGDDEELEPIPAEPWGYGDLDFGYLTAVERSGGRLVLVVNRATVYSGARATAKNGGTPPPGGLYIEDVNPRLRRFPVEEGAPVDAGTRLGGASGDLTRITQDDFLDAARRELSGDAGEGIPVWLRHEGGTDGPVTAIAEHATP